MVQSICYLPLNSAFVVFTFKYKGQSLPNTEYEIYLSIVVSCIQCHYGRAGRKQDIPKAIECLDDLYESEIVGNPFWHLCELTYHGVMENKVTFSSNDLPQGSDTLSLLQGMQSFLESGRSLIYNFLHLSIQELLSGYYMAKWLSDSEQVSQIKQLINQPRFNAVFQFYAAITKLRSPGIRQVLATIAKSKPLLICLLHCLYEAQDPSLCIYVAEKLNHNLDICHTSLSPLDYLSIGFFLWSVTSEEISVDLRRCYISELDERCLTKYLHSDVEHRISIDLYENDIHEGCVSYITPMLNFVEHIYLTSNLIGDNGASLISEAVRETAVLRTLILYNCCISSRGVEDLSRALAHSRSLEKLDIGDNDLGDEGVSHIAEALKQNNQLRELWIGHCKMTDKGAACLASALSVNNSLKMLHISEDKAALTEDRLLIIAKSLANNSEFVKLAGSFEFDHKTTLRVKQVNEERKRNGLLPIKIKR